jgi:hypothetical protein
MEQRDLRAVAKSRFPKWCRGCRGRPEILTGLGEGLGAQNDEIFGGLLDLSAAEIRALRADK